jgi:hypothetical protein
MSNEYSWRDGWGLQFPKSEPQPSLNKNTERISRCQCGSWLYKQQACTICALLEGNQ